MRTAPVEQQFNNVRKAPEDSSPKGKIDLGRIPTNESIPRSGLLFSETPTRFLLEVEPQNLPRLGDIFKTLPWEAIGEVLGNPILDIVGEETIEVDQLREANHGAAP